MSSIKWLKMLTKRAYLLFCELNSSIITQDLVKLKDQKCLVIGDRLFRLRRHSDTQAVLEVSDRNDGEFIAKRYDTRLANGPRTPGVKDIYSVVMRCKEPFSWRVRAGLRYTRLEVRLALSGFLCGIALDELDQCLMRPAGSAKAQLAKQYGIVHLVESAYDSPECIDGEFERLAAPFILDKCELTEQIDGGEFDGVYTESRPELKALIDRRLAAETKEDLQSVVSDLFFWLRGKKYYNPNADFEGMHELVDLLEGSLQGLLLAVQNQDVDQILSSLDSFRRPRDIVCILKAIYEGVKLAEAREFFSRAISQIGIRHPAGNFSEHLPLGGAVSLSNVYNSAEALSTYSGSVLECLVAGSKRKYDALSAQAAAGNKYAAFVGYHLTDPQKVGRWDLRGSNCAFAKSLANNPVLVDEAVADIYDAYGEIPSISLIVHDNLKRSRANSDRASSYVAVDDDAIPF